MDASPHRFRLERIRALRERAEEQAKQALADSMLAEQAAADTVAGASAAVADARAALSGAADRPVDVAAIRAHQNYLERTEAIHASGVEALAGQRRVVESRRDGLVEAARSRQSLDRLRDRSLAAHRREADRAERAVLDEIALNSFRRRSAA
ncbi:flagellar export protein FliJ [Conexibacter sp. DBS9H8]|uniref:flagellar export protein FliJ n=1 Tax=Conexibacter sp. DBS9H8 TaxID=2937801 RepID=UPI00200F98FD|nr:flagellar export protein FliJ [Conexibacter sp. DBS9H8]